MATYNYEQIGSTLKAEWQELKELAKGKTIGQLKLVEKFDVYEEGDDHIFFYYGKLRGMVFGIEDNVPFIAGLMYTWNYTAEDWDELNLEKIILQPYELEQKEQKEQRTISSAQIVVLDYVHNKLDIISTTINPQDFHCDKFLADKGYNKNDIYWSVFYELQINFKTL